MSDAFVPPEVFDRGPGDPEVAVVGGVHGDEPSGVRAVRRLLDADLDLRRGVRFVVANPAAIEAGERYLDSDLNRVFPGDPDGNREERLAARLCDLTGGLATLSLHATHSQPEPFALVHASQPRSFDLAARLPVPYVVDSSGVNDDTLAACGTTIELEAGCQGSDEAAETAERQARAFLRITDALSGDVEDADPDYFTMRSPVRKPGDAPDGAACADVFTLLVDNFEPVDPGTTWARVQGDPLVADERFSPILMSECGYEDIFGFEGRKIGETAEAARRAVAAAD